jgi:L-asparaginase
MERKIAVLGTGGTVAGSGDAPQDNLAYRAGTMAIGDVLAGIPALQGLPLVAEQVAQIDSKDMSLEIWRMLALRCAHWLARDDIAGVVIAHGTDTLEETAFFLQWVLAPAKPVVLTCAMRPATAMFPDGPQNLVDAVAVATTGGARGVVAVCAGVVHGAADVAKRHTYRLDAFTSGDAGPIGHVEERSLRQLRPWPDGEPAPALLQRFAAGPVTWPWVEIVTSHAGAGRGLVDALVAQGVAGLVVAGTGNGSLHHELEAGLLAAQAQGVRVLRSTRCVEGRVLATPHDTLPHAGALSPAKARIALLLELLLRTTAPA